MTTTQQGLGLNFAVDQLVQALEDTVALNGLRDGLARSVGYFSAVEPTDPSYAEAADCARLWRAVDAVAAAVQERRV